MRAAIQVVGAAAFVAAQGGGTVLNAAAANGRVEIVRLLLEKGAEVDSKGEVSLAPLLLATVTRRPQAPPLPALAALSRVNGAESKGLWLKRLPRRRRLSCAHGGALPARKTQKHAALASAPGVPCQMAACCTVASSPMPLQQGQTSLIQSAAFRHTEVVKLLLEHGADVQARDDVSSGGAFRSPAPPKPDQHS